MGRCNNKRAQQQAAARNNVPSRARFSKGPPRKPKGRGGRGGRGAEGRGGRGSGRGDGGRKTAQHQSVISKIAKKVELKTSGGIAGVIHGGGARSSDNAGVKVGTIRKRHALDGVDITKFDEVRLSEETVEYIMDLLTKLNVVESASANKDDEEKKSEEEEQALKETRLALENGKIGSSSLSANAQDFIPTFHHIDGDGNQIQLDHDSSSEEEKDDEEDSFQKKDLDVDSAPFDINNAYAFSAPNGMGLDNNMGGYEEYDDIFGFV